MEYGPDEWENTKNNYKVKPSRKLAIMIWFFLILLLLVFHYGFYF